MSNPTFEEMEAKRMEMISSFKDIAAAMTRCVSIIEDYTRLSPATAHPHAHTLSSADLEAARAVTDTLSQIDPSLISTPGLDSLNQPPVTSSKKVKPPKEKKIKDPNAPKRPPSAYILFQNDVREGLKVEHPGMAYKDLLQIIAEKWKGLSDEAKRDYEGAYQAAQAAFKQNSKAYEDGKAAPVPVAASGSDDSSSEESSDSDEETIHAVNAAVQQPVSTGVITPAMLNAAVTSAPVDAKKEKKRKHKEAAPAVPATPTVADGEKKKKKKKKDEA